MKIYIAYEIKYSKIILYCINLLKPNGFFTYHKV